MNTGLVKEIVLQWHEDVLPRSGKSMVVSGVIECVVVYVCVCGGGHVCV